MKPSLHTAVHHPRFRRLVDAHFRGRCAAYRERELRVHLPECANCRDYYHRNMLFSAADPQAMPACERLSRGLGFKSPAGRVSWLHLGLPIAALTTVLLLVVGLRAKPPEIGVRGPPSAPASQLLVYEIVPGHPARQVISRVARDASLAFAYANIGKKQHLSVFVVDENRQVYWYYPAWTSPTENPMGIPVALDDALHEIPQAIHHRLHGRRVELFGVFADRPLSVRDLETAVSRAERDKNGRLLLDVPGSEIARLDLEVTEAP